MQELKPCPFCGHKPLLRYMKSGGYYRIDCPNCDIVFRVGAGAKERIPERIIHAWNRRPGLTTGEKIRALRKNLGMTQKDLGELLGITASAVGQFETSSTPPKIDTLKKIAKALNASVIDFIEE